MAKRGRPAKPDAERAVKVTITLHPDLIEKIDKLATLRFQARSQFVQQVLVEYIKTHKS